MATSGTFFLSEQELLQLYDESHKFSEEINEYVWDIRATNGMDDLDEISEEQIQEVLRKTNIYLTKINHFIGGDWWHIDYKNKLILFEEKNGEFWQSLSDFDGGSISNDIDDRLIASHPIQVIEVVFADTNSDYQIKVKSIGNLK